MAGRDSIKLSTPDLPCLPDVLHPPDLAALARPTDLHDTFLRMCRVEPCRLRPLRVSDGSLPQVET